MYLGNDIKNKGSLNSVRRCSSFAVVIVACSYHIADVASAAVDIAAVAGAVGVESVEAVDVEAVAGAVDVESVEGAVDVDAVAGAVDVAPAAGASGGASPVALGMMLAICCTANWNSASVRHDSGGLSSTFARAACVRACKSTSQTENENLRWKYA
jgi:hypothetical protein